MPALLIDGQDVLAVKEAVARARAGHGPSLVECRTYRYNEHSAGMDRILESMPDADRYRSTAEVEEWRARDPLKIHRERLIEQGIASEAELTGHEERARRAIEDAVQFARESPYPDPEEIFDDLFTNPIPINRD